MWVFADIERKGEFKVCTFDPNHQLISPKRVVDIQRELLIDTSTILENNIGCSDIINPIIERDAKECILSREGDAQAFDTEYWTSAQSLQLVRGSLPFTNTVPEALPVLASFDRSRLNSAACSFYLVSNYLMVKEKGYVPYQKAA
jgi:hypothetical protein